MMREITLADVFVHMDMDSKKIKNALDTYLKDKPMDYMVVIADRVKDTTKRFTKLELKLAESDLYDRECSPKVVNEFDYKHWIYNIIDNNRSKFVKTDKYPSLEVLRKNNICLQFSPSNIFHDPIDNTLTLVEPLSKSYETYEDIDWADVRILYDIYRKVNDSRYYVKCISHKKLERLKALNDHPYGLSRVL